MCVLGILDFRSKILDCFVQLPLRNSAFPFANSALKKDCYSPQRFTKQIAKVRKEGNVSCMAFSEMKKRAVSDFIVFQKLGMALNTFLTNFKSFYYLQLIPTNKYWSEQLQ